MKQYRELVEAYKRIYEQQKIGIPLDAPTDSAAARKLREILPSSEKGNVVIPKSGLQKAHYEPEGEDLTEQRDIYDEVLEILLDEGYSEKECNQIMVQLVSEINLDPFSGIKNTVGLARKAVGYMSNPKSIPVKSPGGYSILPKAGDPYHKIGYPPETKSQKPQLEKPSKTSSPSKPTTKPTIKPTPKPALKLPKLTPVSAAGALNKVGFVGTALAAADQAKKVFNPKDNIVTRVGDLANTISNNGKPGPGHSRYKPSAEEQGIGANQRVAAPYTPPRPAAIEKPKPKAEPVVQPKVEPIRKKIVPPVAKPKAEPVDPDVQKYQELRKSDPSAAKELGMKIWNRKYRPGTTSPEIV